MVVEVDESAVAAARARIHRSLQLAVDRGKLEAEARDEAVDRMRFTWSPNELADRDVVVEAVPEQEQVKVETFRTLDKVVDRADALLASNTSSIPIMKLAMATHRPERVIGIHFFNPVPVLPLVELVPSLLTSPATEEDASGFAGGLGKHVIRSQDRAGFVVNALLVPYILSAIRMLESGFATAEDIDQGMVQGCAHPMGPLALADLIGLDTISASRCRCTRSSRSRSTRRPRSSRGWSMPGCSAGSPVGASSTTGAEPRSVTSCAARGARR